MVKSLKPFLSYAPYWGYLLILMSRFQILQFPGPEMTSFPKKCKKRFQFFETKIQILNSCDLTEFFHYFYYSTEKICEEKTCQIDVVNFFKSLCLKKFKTLIAIFEQSGYFWTWKMEYLKFMKTYLVKLSTAVFNLN